jgi:hypothetical protein
MPWRSAITGKTGDIGSHLADCLKLRAPIVSPAEGIDAPENRRFNRKREKRYWGSGKISSNINDLILLMEKTPKIISLFKKACAKSPAGRLQASGPRFSGRLN